jgi:protein MpaA
MIFNQLPSGTSVAGNPIEAFKTHLKSNKYLYLLAGTHGDEVEGIYVLKKLFDWLKETDFAHNLPIIVIPVLNVDGHQSMTRVNANQVDLNRNYPTSDWSPSYKQKKYNPGTEALSEPENKFLISLFNQYAPAIILSFHSWKPILNYNGDSKDIAQYLAEHNGYPIDGDIGYPTPGSLGTFGPQKYNAGVLTFECPPLSERNNSLEAIWLENEKGLKGLFTDNIFKKKFNN